MALGTQSSGGNPGETFDLTINSPTSITLTYSFPYADTSCGEFVQTSTFTVGRIEVDTGIMEYVPGSWTMDITVDFSCMSTEEFTFGSFSGVISIVKEEGFPYNFLTPDDIYDNPELGFVIPIVVEVLDQLNNRVMEYSFTITLTENTSTSIAGTLVGDYAPDCPTGSFTMSADEFKDLSVDYTDEYFVPVPDFHKGAPDLSDLQRVAMSIPGEPGPWLMHQREERGPGLEDVRADSPVWRLDPHQHIGDVERVLFDADTNTITGIVIRRGRIFKHEVVLDASYIVEVVGEIVRVQIDDGALKSLPAFVAPD